jgi:hypothetical protein
VTDLTAPLREAVAEAEELIRTAPFVETEQDLLEGYAYLAGRVRASVQLAFDHDLDRPVFINSTHQFCRQGLDNPDAVYFHAYIRDDAEYVVRGRRGSTTDLSFQVMDGGYGPAAAPGSVAAFDDRALDIAADGTFELRLGPAREDAPPGYVTLGEGAKTLIVREVYSDWNAEERGLLWIRRVGTEGRPAASLRRERLARQYEVAGKLLVGSIKTWFAFPEWFTYQEPVNTLTVPALTPGGLESQYSSIGHYELTDEQALVVTVPRCGNPYQAIQVGSPWYVSTDYENHQTSLTVAQSHVDEDGLLRYVVSDRDPGIANWLETTGHRRGVMMLRWQRLDRALTADDGPRVEVVDVDVLHEKVPELAAQRVTPEEYAARIALRQEGVARRMLS